MKLFMSKVLNVLLEIITIAVCLPGISFVNKIKK